MQGNRCAFSKGRQVWGVFSSEPAAFIGRHRPTKVWRIYMIEVSWQLKTLMGATLPVQVCSAVSVGRKRAQEAIILTDISKAR